MDIKMSALEYVRGVKNGDISAEDFVASTIERISKIDGMLHAFLTVNEDAIDYARIVDKKISSGENVGACHGMPISVKDNICIRDKITTCGSKMLENFISPYDATVIERLKKEDATLIGKTNLDEFAMGLTTEFSAFGPSKNPWDTRFIPGGSSGGSAVSVASYECIASLGSDTGGSVRNPASFCSVVGYKPTYGLVSRFGLVSYANSLEQIGPLARNVSDAAFVLDIISGHDVNDDTTVHDSDDSYLKNISVGIDGKKIGIIKEMITKDTDPAVSSAMQKAISKFESLGAVCEEVSLDMVEYSVAAYYTITSAEAGSNLARYDNVLYGHEFPTDGYGYDAYISKARLLFGPEVIRRMIIGGFVPSAGHSGRYFLKALKVKSKLTRQINDAFKKYDFLVAPTVPILPFKFGEKIDDPVYLFLVDINTVTANLTGKPAITVPFTLSNGLPIGIQIMADSMNDRQLLQAAYALEQTVKIQEVPI